MNLSITQKIVISFAAIAAATLALVGTVTAIGEGQIGGGNFYTVRNVTKGGAYGDSISADKCDTLKYSVRLHNPGPGDVNNVNVKIVLPTGAGTQNVSTATVTSQNSDPATVSDTATVNISSSQKINYINGSSVLLDANGNVIQSLSDSLVNGSGVNIGQVKVSLAQIKFVQFQAKINCPSIPPCEQNPNLPECNPCKDHPQKPECNPCKEHPNMPGCNPTCKEKPNMPECQPCKNNPNRPECQPCNQNPNLPQCKPPCQDNQKNSDECSPPQTPGMGGGSSESGTPTGSAGVSNLVNTGPGEVAALFTVVSTAGTIGYRLFLGRRLSLGS